MVWSRADRNMPSNTAPRISSLARTLRPRAGSSVIDGAWAPSLGIDSMKLLPSCSGSVALGLVRCIREVVLVGGLAVDLCRQRPAEAPEGLQDDRPLRRRQVADDGTEAFALRRLGLRERLHPGGPG